MEINWLHLFSLADVKFEIKINSKSIHSSLSHPVTFESTLKIPSDGFLFTRAPKRKANGSSTVKWNTMDNMNVRTISPGKMTVIICIKEV